MSITKHLQPLLPTVRSFLVTLLYQWKMWTNTWCTRVHQAIRPDQLPNWILRDMAGIITSPMCHLFNNSLRDFYIPTIWKSANICPLPKTKPIQDICKDLWPISPTPVVAKMLEQYPVNHMRVTCRNVESSQFGAVKCS